ncbi:deaminase domain-containing protein [Lysinibacillus irui]|uniref:deaminase domain-containing protein n=2 Tax=Lysinibacillus TaxID=400634 RepID=UPI003D2E7415
MEPLKINKDMSTKEKILRTGFNMSLQQAQKSKGKFDATVDVAKNTYNDVKKLVTDPIGVLEETKDNLKNFASHPLATVKTMAGSVKDSFEKDVIHGNDYSRAYWGTKATINTATAVVGTKGVGTLTKIGKTSTGVTSGKFTNSLSSKGTIKDRVSNRAIDRYYEKTQNIRSDINKEIEKIINSDEYKNLSNTQKNKLDRKVKKMSTANVAVADVSILGIKKEFQAHSQIHSSDSLGSNVGDFSYSKTDRLLETYVDDGFPRFNDTEAKILEDIASQIKDPNTKGRIDLFTDLDACQSCTNLIMEFRRKYPNIELNVYSKNMR